MRCLFRLACVQQQTWLLRCLRIHSRNLNTSTRLQAAVRKTQSIKLILRPGSKNHNSLATFVEYAKRINLEPTKSYYKGTHYEYAAAETMLRLGFSLIRSGKRSDAGIDLIGHWNLPQFLEPIPVIVQCKAFKTRLSPRHVRELEGSFQGRPPEWRNRSVLGLLVSTQKASLGVLATLKSHDRPLGFMRITEEGRIEQFIWNAAAGDHGLAGLDVTRRYTLKSLLKPVNGLILEQGQAGKSWEVPEKVWKPRKHLVEEAKTETDIVLTWKGIPINPGRDELDEETLQLKKRIMGEEGEVEVVEPKKNRRASRKIAVEPVIQSKKMRRSPRKTVFEDVVDVVEKPGRRLAPKSKETETVELQVPVQRKRGRPKGSKNKPKTVALAVT